MREKLITDQIAAIKTKIKKIISSPIKILDIVIFCLVAGLLIQKANFFPYILYAGMFSLSFIFACLYLLLMVQKTFRWAKPKFDKIIREKRERQRHLNSLNMKTINVAFLCDSPSFWTSFEELYFSLNGDKRFNVALVAVPEIQNGKIVNYNMVRFFESNGFSFINCKEFIHNLRHFRYHYVFPSRPYDHVRLPNMKNADLNKFAKLCHITYGTCIFNGKTLDIVCGFKHLKEYDIVFSETPDHTSIYLEKQRKFPFTGTEIVQVGSPKFDYIHSRNFESNPRTFRQVILYTPRWTIAGGTCSFLNLYEYFFELAEENPDIKYIFRPHPLMKKSFSGPIWTEEKWDEFVHKFEEIDNAVIDLNPDYIQSFKEATVLVSDMSSLLPEFLLTKKPVVYFHKKYQFNLFGKHISEGFYWCHSRNEVDSILKSLRNDNDPKAEKRESVIDNYFYFAHKSAASMIEDTLLKDYFSMD